MILTLIWCCLPIVIILNYIFAKQTKRTKIYNKKVLIIGGGSGLGESLAHKLNIGFNKVTITSRDQNLIDEINTCTNMKAFYCDVFDDSSFENVLTDYDIIFYCTGLSIPASLNKSSVKSFELCEGTNYLGMIKILKNYISLNKKPFDFIMIGSTLATFPLEGYSTYSPSKSAMLSFFYSTYRELKNMGVNLHFFSPPNMQTRGFDIENRTKPKYAKTIESIFRVYDPDDCANFLIENFQNRKIITIDWFTYFCHIRFDCEKMIDYLFFPVSIIVLWCAKTFTAISYNIFNK
ncbi:3-ketodihydrosphingosine reductase [Vairimorpha necatrix]|uniref:3-ketodihydrosphingosine reductase n=1 Tax=Vairimorpha necatrix TaxID=6039 RepID=A0AAX4J8G5_9MICR